MYIAPNSTIRILHGIRISPDYKNTIYWGLPENQTNYFIGKSKYTLSEQSYQRAGSGVLRVQLPVDSLYDCNYLMFQNTSYGTKWFYAFIIGMTYVNNITTEIRYSIDVMQTWFYGVDMNPCMVEREHISVRDDFIGRHIEPEPIDIHTMTYGSQQLTSGYFSNYIMVIAMAYNDQITLPTNLRGLVSGIYSGVCYIPIALNNASDIATANALLDNIVALNLTDSVVALFMYPSRFYDGPNDGPEEPHYESFRVPNSLVWGNIDGYVPKNKKLFTYPYNCLNMSDYNGQSIDLRTEMFTEFSDEVYFGFMFIGALSCHPEIICVPMGYKNMLYDFEDKISMRDFPQCAFAVDAYKAWVANFGLVEWQTSKAFNMAEGAKQILTGGGLMPRTPATPNNGIYGMANTASGLLGVAETNAKLNIEFERAYYAPDYAKGTPATTAMVAARRAEIRFRQCCVTAQEAEQIDNFFSMYGYACNKVKVPNVAVRRYWNFVKTRNSNVTPNLDRGGCPADVIQQINEIFDNGVTFWMNADLVGRYEYDNNIPV